MAGQDRSAKDKQRASYMKAQGIERWSGVCACCYRIIPNDTFGGAGARNHYPAGCMTARTGKQGRLKRGQ